MTGSPLVLADLLAECNAHGIRLALADGGGLAVDAPEDALTPDLLARLKAHKAELLAALRPPVAPVEPAEAVLQEECIEPPDPCPNCRGLVFWWDIPGDQRCMACDPPVKAIRALEIVERIRRRHRIPSPPGVPEMLADLKRIISENP